MPNDPVVPARRSGVVLPVVLAVLLATSQVLSSALAAAPAHALVGALADAGTPSPAWGWPLPGRPEVARRFAPGPTPYSPGHYGVDLAGTAGTPVLAAGDGTVTFAGQVAGRGVVVVEHGRLRTGYEPVDPLVALGDVVGRGEVVGLLLPSGHACAAGGPCLHWGLRDGERYLDPLRLVRRPVRLLPAAGPGVAAAGPLLAPATAWRPARVRAGPGVLAAVAAGGGVLPAALLRGLARERRP